MNKIPFKFEVSDLIRFRRPILRQIPQTLQMQRIGEIEENGVVERVSTSSVTVRTEHGIIHRVYFKDIITSHTLEYRSA